MSSNEIDLSSKQQIFNAIAVAWLSGRFEHPREILKGEPPKTAVRARWLYDVISDRFEMEGPYPLRILRSTAHTCHCDIQNDHYNLWINGRRHQEGYWIEDRWSPEAETPEALRTHLVSGPED